MSEDKKNKVDLENKNLITEVESEQDITELIQKAEEFRNIALRAQADYQNLQKETSKWKEDFVKYAKADLLTELLPVYSNYKIALEHIPEEQREANWIQGILHIYKMLQDFFSKMNISEIKTVGEIFNHQYHDIVDHTQDHAKQDNEIIKEVQPGYMLDNKVLQPAKVIVNHLDNNNSDSEAKASDEE